MNALYYWMDFNTVAKKEYWKFYDKESNLIKVLSELGMVEA